MKSSIFSASLLVCSVAFASQPAIAEIKLDTLKQWLDILPETLDERAATSSNYLQNYLQCMDDEQALRNEGDASIRALINDALDSGNACSYLLEGLVDDLTDDKFIKDDRKKLPENAL